MIGKLRDILRGRDGEWILSLSTPEDPRALFDELADKQVDIEIKQFRNRRSLDANAFAWVLIGKIAEKMGLPKLDVYRNAIKDLGGVYDIVCIQNKAVDRLISGWEKNGLGWIAETFPSRIEDCTNVILYYGSSTYDTKQFSGFLSNLVQDAEALGIPTIPDDEVTRMINKWGQKHESKEHH